MENGSWVAVAVSLIVAAASVSAQPSDAKPEAPASTSPAEPSASSATGGQPAARPRASSPTGLWRCGNEYTNSEVEAAARGCQPIERTPVIVIERVPPTTAEVTRFRSRLKPGDQAEEGLVIEVKPPLAKIQARFGERWFRISDIGPAWKVKSK